MFLASVALFTACVATGQEPEKPYIDPAKELAKVLRVVPPVYPPVAVERRLEGIVDVDGIVQPAGNLVDSKYTASSADAAIFIPAVQDVIEFWAFEPAVGEDCQPVARSVTTRVHFEMDGETPRIFVSRGTAPPAPLQRQDFQAADYKVTHRSEPQYPKTMIHQNIQASVYALMVIEPSGEVSDVRAKAYLVLPHYNKHVGARWQIEQLLEQQRTTDLTPFLNSAVRALKAWRYGPVERQARRLACMDINFQLR